MCSDTASVTTDVATDASRWLYTTDNPQPAKAISN
jgi:hypothetical protein